VPEEGTEPLVIFDLHPDLNESRNLATEFSESSEKNSKISVFSVAVT
jgi:hypothetical protein